VELIVTFQFVVLITYSNGRRFIQIVLNFAKCWDEMMVGIG